MTGKIFIVDDDKDMCDLLEMDLKRRGHLPFSFPRAAEALELLKTEDVDLLITDVSLPGISGIDLCAEVNNERPDIPVIVITAFGSLDTAVAAIRAGAYDFVTKPIDLDLLGLCIERALRHRELHEKVKVLSAELEKTGEYEKIIGSSRSVQRLHSQLSRIADTDASVLIVGESGTGKELVAQALHSHSRRSSRPFVAINCSALPENLLESELFGFKRGAFTDAREDRHGLFLEADQGTLFLDEIGDIPMTLQPKLLRALEERKVRPIGGKAEEEFDVRLITATNRDLESKVSEGLFREDLYYRINVIQVTVPPLRSRGTDTLLLAGHFLRQFAARSGKAVEGISEAAAKKLLDYGWPGNVRELRNAIERAVALTQHDKITVEDLPDRIRDFHSAHLILGSSDPEELSSLDEVERRYILHVLEATGDNRSLASRILGIDRKTLYRKLQQYEEDDQES